MKKAIWFVSILILAVTLPLLAQDGKLVAVTAEKEVDIPSGDIAAARTVALAAAARDAVEKAFGSYVKVEEMPNARTVMAQTAAGLQYKILAEQQRGKKYWVKIQANVQIPAQYVLDTAPPVEREDLGDNINNFVQKYPQGEINWGTGVVLAFGKGVISAADSANAEENAARAAEVDAKAHLLEIINDLPVDDRMKTRDDKRMSFALEGFVQGAEIVTQSRTGTTVNVTVQAPLRGVKGLTMAIYGFYTPEVAPTPSEPVTPVTPKPEKPKPATKPPKPEPPKPQAEQPKAEATPEAKPTKPEVKPQATETKPQLKEPASPTAQFSGVVIDARAVAVAPAIFPKVQDTKQQDVYNVKDVNQEDLQKRGMASYATVSRDVTISKLFPKALVIAVNYMPEGAADAAKAKRRQGYKPLVVKAAGADGKTIKANLVISEEDAKKLQELNKATGALKECRVVVVVSSEIGGLEGKLLSYNLADQPNGD